MDESDVLSKLKEEFPDALQHETGSYTAFSVKNEKGKKRNFIQISKSRVGIKVAILSRFLSSQEKGLFTIAPKQHGWAIDADYIIQSEADLVAVLPFIRKSYEGVRNGDWQGGIYQEFKDLLSAFVEQANMNIRMTEGHSERLEGTGTIYPAIEIGGIPYKIKMGERGKFGPKSGTGCQTVPYIGYKYTTNLGDSWINIRLVFEEYKVTAFKLIKWSAGGQTSDLGKEYKIADLKLHLERKPNARLKKFYDDFLSFYEGDEMAETRINPQVEMYMNSLLASHNLILRGAPGTGKTYLAKQIAEELTGGDPEQIGFVQFHPSYDYTDFVEGLRPVKDDSGEIKFDIKPGIFKEFCQKAIASSKIGGQDNFDEAWESYLEFINSSEKKEYVTETSYLTVNSRQNLTINYDSGTSGSTLPRRYVYELYKNKNYDKQKYYRSSGRTVLATLKQKFGLKPYQAPEDIQSDKKFVFIIDEINRGEISKIFGELFYAIDPGYRGKKGEISTQYANMHEGEEKFYIPENVYIIGTMNDTDRSVDSFDFAMRRRFRFVEITAAESLGMWENQLDASEIGEASRRLTNLNNAIENVADLNRNYHIGPSYFLVLPQLDYDYNLFWKDYIQPLLEEYLRGSYQEAEVLEGLKAAFDKLEDIGYVDKG
ncbi:TPA: AAA family ATPase [Streptococcus suis]|nr:AAA family ATPase [Streptococcus suis]